MTGTSTSAGEPGRVLVFLVVASALLVSLVLALWGRNGVLLYGDEHLSVYKLGIGYGDILGAYDRRGTGVGFLLLQKVAVDLFGPGPFAYRLPANLGALGAVLVMYPMGRRLVGAWPALVATPLLATTSLFVHYSRFGRTYSILVFLILLFAGGVHALSTGAVARSRSSTRRGPLRQNVRGSVLLVIVSGGLLPWFHLTTVASCVLIGVGGLSVLCARREFGGARRLAFALAGGGVLAALLTLPAWTAMTEFLTAKTGFDAPVFRPWQVVAVMTGTQLAGAVFVVLLPLAAVLFSFVRRLESAIVIGAAIAPLVLVLLTQPDGRVYGYARYQIAALPFHVLLCAWLLVTALERLPAMRRVPGRQGKVGLAAGILVAGVLFVTGPLVQDPGAWGPFANSNLSLMRLPCFDARWDRMPAIYDEFAESETPLRILETPEQVSRSALLYRNYALHHGQEVEIGFLLRLPSFKKSPSGPYVRVTGKTIREADVDYVVVHKNIEQELRAYWLFVQREVWDEALEPELAAFIEEHGNYGQRFRGQEIPLEPFDRLGEPVYRDEFVDVYAMR